jgi:hypothetical protein
VIVLKKWQLLTAYNCSTSLEGITAPSVWGGLAPPVNIITHLGFDVASSVTLPPSYFNILGRRIALKSLPDW